MTNKEQVKRLLKEIWLEYNAALHEHGDISSLHEGYAVLLEEVDELWDEIKSKESSQTRIEQEAVQVAAMALKILTFNARHDS